MIAQTQHSNLTNLPLFCLLFFCFFALPSCQNKSTHHFTTSRSFYHWKTTWNPNRSELDIFRQQACRKLYLHFFDVDFNPESRLILPIGTIHILAPLPAGAAVVPVIYITQRTLLQLSDSNTEKTAENIAGRIAALCEAASINPSEIQLDADWTIRSKTQYFALLEALKRQPFSRNKIISCTIRMHQVKNLLASGIPPVDRGMLMCYNTGALKDIKTENSILEADEAISYLGNLANYPLPLDVALPLFRWCVWFRGPTFQGILRNVEPEELAADPGHFNRKKNNLYRCEKDTVFHGYSFKMGDMIRTETSPLKDVLKVANFTANHLANDTLTIALYHLDSNTLSHYSHEDLEKIFSCY